MAIKKEEKINVLLLGAIGTGKTTSLKTITDCGKELFILAVEPGIHTIMGDTSEDSVHWHYVQPAKIDWDILKDNAMKINKLPMSALQKIELNKSAYQQFIEVLSTLADFTCDRTGECFGPVDAWGPERVLVVDGLSGISKMSLQLACGAKPIRTQPEWLVAQDNLRNLLDKLTADTKCSFVMLAHTTRRENKLDGGSYITVSTIGQALAPDVPKFFDEVVYANRIGTEFSWSTIEGNVDLKSRILPLEEGMKPDFSLVFGKG